MTNRDDVVAQIEIGMRQLIARVVVFNTAVAASLGIGAADSQLLSLVQLLGPLPVGRLASDLGVTPGAITQAVDRLAAGGYVSRRRDPADGRKVLVTANDVVLRERVLPIFASRQAALDDVHAGLSDRHLQVVADYLVAVLAAPARDLQPSVERARPVRVDQNPGEQQCPLSRGPTTRRSVARRER